MIEVKRIEGPVSTTGRKRKSTGWCYLRAGWTGWQSCFNFGLLYAQSRRLPSHAQKRSIGRVPAKRQVTGGRLGKSLHYAEQTQTVVVSVLSGGVVDLNRHQGLA
jgi:hypothetical protein